MRMIRLMTYVIILGLLCPAVVMADSLLNESGEGLMDMYGSRTASRVGDVITIVFNEKTTASQTAKGKLKNTFKTGADQGTGLLEKFLGLGVSGGETTNVETKTVQQHSLSTTLSVRVVEVLPNNQLMVKGAKILEVNHERQKLTVTGIIRKRDVKPDNTVESTKIGDLKARVNGLPIQRSVKRRRGGIIRWVWQLLF